MDRPKELYLVWQDGVDEQFYNQYFSLSDAAHEAGKDNEIFKASLENMGQYEIVTTIVKKKKGKK